MNTKLIYRGQGLRYNASNVQNVSPFSQKRFEILGDGLSTELEVDLTKAPLGMEFRGDKYPAAVYLVEKGGSVGVPPATDVVVSTEAGKVYFIFSVPIPEMESVSITVSLWYD